MEHQHSPIRISVADEEPLTLPHFDEEATLQSARPVVPLHEVEDKSQFRRRLILVGALCVAAVIGAVTASIIYDQRTHPGPQTTAVTVPSESSESEFLPPSSEVTGAQVDPASAVEPLSETTIAETTVAKEADDGSEIRNGRPPLRTRTSVSNAPAQPERRVREPEVGNRTERDVQTEEEMFWERRREARRLRRERRVNDRRSGDELTRIREIFEGSPRP